MIVGYGLGDEQSRILKVPLRVMEDWLFARIETEMQNITQKEGDDGE